ncbi:hypothetical protein KKH43_06470 [Patescibacteria group bacterium]|nr:hypothetical protein [Patescibacteria group bacterium]
MAVFQGKKIRRVWDEKKEKWYFSVVDIIEALTESTVPKRYWSDLKNQLKNKGSEVYEKIVRLKLKAQDGPIHSTALAFPQPVGFSRWVVESPIFILKN